MENGAQFPKAQSIKDFTDLETWKLGRKLRQVIYGLTGKFPNQETYSLISQMRRAALSVTANIAEGFGRYSYQENMQFCRLSRGSVYELRDHLTSALDAGYIDHEQFSRTDALAISVIKLLNGYIRSTKLRKSPTRKADAAK